MNIKEQLKRAVEQRRFWDLVDKSGDCWLWTGTTNGRGYGWFYCDWTAGAHRYSYWLHTGEKPTRFIRHTCENKHCVNPDHLYQTKPPKDKPVSPLIDAKGEHNGRAILTEEEVVRMRKLYKEGPYSHVDLARMFQISSTQASRIIARQSWCHV